MLFNTIQYLLFFIIVFCIYWILPQKAKNPFLLIASYFFYMQWNPYYIVLIVGITLISYFAGYFIEKSQERKAKYILGISIFISLGILGIFKYFNFFIANANRILSRLGISTFEFTSSLILPVGISFYTLQAIGYVIDVYRKEIRAQKNFLKYALFVSFFPQLVAGPIERSKNLLTQLDSDKKFSLYNFRKGLILIVYGLFVKMAIADRAAIFVDAVYSDYVTHNGFLIPIATILFAIQIYCDFYGYSVIARGTALTLGIELMENFNAPYFSKSIKEFWRRWHISLSTWFKDYLYIPLGGNRKGKIRQLINLLIVFSVSGLWHGSSMNYVIWGFLNGLYQNISIAFKPLKKIYIKVSGWRERTAGNIMRTIGTFLLVSFTWLFFRAASLREAINMIKNVCVRDAWQVFLNGAIYELGIDRNHFSALLLFIFVVLIVDYFKFKGKNVADTLLSQYIWARISVEIVLIFIILLFGCYGVMYDAESFIYFQF